jgi:Cu-processing system permease protein
MNKIIKYVILDILRSKIVIAYTIFLLAVSLSMFMLDSNSAKGTLSLVNIILIVVPLISIIFSTIHFYNSYEFIELLVAQPLKRSRIIISEYIGIALSLCMAFFLGTGIPVLIFDSSITGITIIISGLLLTAIFVSIAFLCSVITRDKAKGIGVSILVWFYFSLIYDGIILFVLFSFSDYPIENLVMFLTCLNPVDLGRIMMLLQLDVSALMGYTGALYHDFLGNTTGMFVSCTILFIWLFVPLITSVLIFRKKDL